MIANYLLDGYLPTCFFTFIAISTRFLISKFIFTFSFFTFYGTYSYFLYTLGILIKVLKIIIAQFLI